MTVKDHPLAPPWWPSNSRRPGPDLLTRLVSTGAFAYVESKWWDKPTPAVRDTAVQVLKYLKRRTHRGDSGEDRICRDSGLGCKFRGVWDSLSESRASIAWVSPCALILGDCNLVPMVGEKVKGPETIRRSVTIRPELDNRIRDLVAACTRHRINLDYTKALNLLAELGENWLEGSDVEDREKYRDLFQKYLDYDFLEESEVLADWYELEEFRKWKQSKAAMASKPQISTKNSA